MATSPIQFRVRASRADNLRSQYASGPTGTDRSITRQGAPIHPAPLGGESPTVRLFSSAHEDIARLTCILRGQHCAATMRGVDGVILALDVSGSQAARPDFGELEDPLSAPILDPEGRVLASLEVVFNNTDRSDSSDRLLRALIDAAARSMSERWFRLVHSRQWIIAAMRRNAPHTCVLLAVDGEQRLLGAEKAARQLLLRVGRGFERCMPLSVLFEAIPTLRRRGGHGDTSLSLRGSSDREPWVAFLTPPDIGAHCAGHEAHTMLHIRPRLEQLTRLLFVWPQGPEHGGLTRGSLNRIEEYVQSNLESTLDIDELAGLVRMSASHFTRSFSKTVGLTPHRYVIQCRVEKARELLTATDLPLTEIALTTGFSDQSHFSRRFQELMGFTPGAYRRIDNHA